MKTYIQKGSDAKKDILAVYGITTKSIPDAQLEQKEVFSRSWVERQGSEEYIPETPIFKDYEQDLEFVCKSTLKTAGGLIKTFISYITGGEFSLYDEFTQRGLRCRFISYDTKAFYRYGDDVVVFTVKVKINNPLCYAMSTDVKTISWTTNSDTIAYWDDGTSNTYTSATGVTKTFLDNGHFVIICPQKL